MWQNKIMLIVVNIIPKDYNLFFSFHRSEECNVNTKVNPKFNFTFEDFNVRYECLVIFSGIFLLITRASFDIFKIVLLTDIVHWIG